MKLATFTHDNSTRIGIVEGEEVVDLSAAAPALPQDMLSFIEAGAPALGDVVRIEIEGIGRIENRMIDEPESTRVK